MTVSVWKWDPVQQIPQEIKAQSIVGEGLMRYALMPDGIKNRFSTDFCDSEQTLLECRQIKMMLQVNDAVQKLDVARANQKRFEEVWAKRIEEGKTVNAEINDLLE